MFACAREFDDLSVQLFVVLFTLKALTTYYAFVTNVTNVTNNVIIVIAVRFPWHILLALSWYFVGLLVTVVIPSSLDSGGSGLDPARPVL